METPHLRAEVLPINHLLVIDNDPKTDIFIDKITDTVNLIQRYVLTTSGLNALKYLCLCERSNCFPNLIILNPDLPDMDGLEFIDRYQTTFFPKFKETKVVVADHSTNVFEKEMVVSHSCVDMVVEKPLIKNNFFSMYESFYRVPVDECLRS